MKIRAIVLLVLGAIVVSACGLEKDPVVIFDDAWLAYEEQYGGFDQRAVDWDAAYETWRAELDHESSEDELYAAICGLLAELNDGHVRAIAPGRLLCHSSRVRREKDGWDLYDADRFREHYLDPGYTVDGASTWGTLGDRAVYFQADYIIDDFASIDQALAAAESRGVPLIVDLRHNPGGDFTGAYNVLSEWVVDETPAIRSRTRNGPRRDSFDAWHTWSLRGGGSEPSVPVGVLTDRFTISAAERAVWLFRAIPGVALFGEPTNGSIATMLGRQLLNGWMIAIPVQETEGPDGEVFEGVGITPDFAGADDPATEDVDELIELALEVLGG